MLIDGHACMAWQYASTTRCTSWPGMLLGENILGLAHTNSVACSKSAPAPVK